MPGGPAGSTCGTKAPPPAGGGAPRGGGGEEAPTLPRRPHALSPGIAMYPSRRACFGPYEKLRVFREAQCISILPNPVPDTEASA